MVKSAVQNSSLMGDDNVQLSIISTDILSFSKGDKIVVDGEEYTIRTKVNREVLSDEHFVHDATFYGVMYELMKSLYRNTDADGKSTSHTFDLTYSIRDFVRVLIYNVNRDYPGLWQFDEESCPDTEPRTIAFSKNNCLQVLQKLCSDSEFKLEFLITQSEGVRTIHIGKFGSKVVPPGGNEFFEWGKGNGLYKLKEQKVDDKAIITRLWVEGGTNNIRSNYRNYSERLQLPYPKRLNLKEHSLSDGTVIPAGSEMIGISDDNNRYLEDADLRDMIGSDEDAKTYDNIFPKRTGEVTSIVEDNINSFIDSTMDFDLNETDEKGTKYLINGVSAKVTFTSGKLAGQEFELLEKGGYEHESKKFTLIPFTDKRGLTIPTVETEAYRIQVGDKYKITDINLPESYEQNAEEELWYTAVEDFKPMTQARAQYQLTLDRSYFLDSLPTDSDTRVFRVGDYVPVKDVRLGIEKNIRIQKVTRNLLLEHDYTITLSDITAISIQSQTVLDVREHEMIIENNRLRDFTKARRGWRTTEELRSMVYDTDGYFDPDNIRPNSIDTNMLTVGSKSQQFILVDVVLQANVGGLGNRFNATSGKLVHLTIDDGKIKTWDMGAAEFTMASNKGYYLFAKCDKNGSSGVWYLTQEQLRFEPTEDPNNYYFQVGILSSLYPDDKFRDFATTYGFTRINGNTITTGRIVTSDGECYLDLDDNKFRIGDASSSIDWNATAKNQVTLKNVKLVSGSGDVSDIGVYRGTYNPNYVYYKGDEVSYTHNGETCTYRYINNDPSLGHLPTDSAYWAIVAQGSKGDAGEAGEDGRTTYLHIKYSDNGGLSFTANNGEDPGDYIGQYTDFEQMDSDNPEDYTWSRIKGESGTAGSDGSVGEYYEYRYAKNGSTTAPPPLDANSPNPTGWSTQMPSVGALEYVWCIMAKKSGLVDKTKINIPVTDGSVADVSGNGYNGVLSNGASVIQDGTRYAMNLSENGECSIPYDLPFGESFTLCFWIKVAQSEIKWMLNAYNGRDYVEKTIPCTANTWFHLAFRFNDRTVTVFKNGTVLHSGSVSDQVVGFALYDDNMFGSNVYFDEVRLLNTAIPVSDVEKIMNGTVDELIQKWSTPIRVNPYDGKNGADGVSVETVDVEYAKSASNTTAPTTGWQTTAPTWEDGKYIWSRTKILYSDGTTSYTKAACITGGVGANGVGVSSMVEQYYQSSSATSLLNGSWSTTRPTWKNGWYIWTRTVITYTNGTATTTAAICVTGEKGADGEKGDPGEKGEKGDSPVLVFRGDYDSAKTYYGDKNRLDAVKYNSLYYIARIDAGTFSNVLPTNTSKWNSFGAQFETVATQLLLAENANIAGWIFRNGRLESEAQTKSGEPMMYLDGTKGEARLNGIIQMSCSYSGNISDSNLFYLPSQASQKKLSMGHEREDIGKVVRLFHSGKIGSADYLIYCATFGISMNFTDATLGGFYATLRPQECVELTCFKLPPGSFDIKGSWQITGRFGFEQFRHDTSKYGRHPMMIAMGVMHGDSKQANCYLSGNWYDGRSLSSVMSITRSGVGYYTINMKSGLLPEGYMVFATGTGTDEMKPTVQMNSTSSFVIYISDDDSRNDGSCVFMIMDPNWWYKSE